MVSIPFEFPTRRRMPCAVSGLLFTVLLVAQAQAQTQPSATTRPDPLDPKAQVPSVRYESSFAQFWRIDGDKPVTWRGANDTVARIGGWRTYAREAQQPDPAAAQTQAGPAQTSPKTPAPASAPAIKPIAAGHSGHKH